MLAEEFEVLDGASPLWQAIRPFLEAALRLEQEADTYVWHGWTKRQIEEFLASLPARCSLVVGVWETASTDAAALGDEHLLLGAVCEVADGEVRSLRTFQALEAAGLKPVAQLEPGYEDALEIMRAAREQVAPAAWALFTDRETWQTWVLGDEEADLPLDKGERLAELARRGRCVLMGSRTAHAHWS